MKQWKETLVSKTMSIREVIRVINANSMQIALVVDENGLLLGTTTDGDIRRGILKGFSLEDSVDRVMNKNPMTANKSEKPEQILEKMHQHQFRHIPIVDDDFRVVGIEVLENLLLPKDKENWVVLMAGGKGRRMSPLTDDCPKPLLRVGNKPLLEIILNNFIQFGFRNFYVSVNYKAEMIKNYFGDGSRWGSKIRYIDESRQLGTAGALGLLPQRPDKPVIVMNGDLLTNVNLDQLQQFHVEHGAKVTACVREYDFQVPYGVVRMSDHRITGIDEKPVQKFFVNAGIYVLEPSVLDLIPKEEPLDMPALIERLIARKDEVAAFPVREYWLDIGRRSDFERANGEYSEEFE